MGQQTTEQVLRGLAAALRYRADHPVKTSLSASYVAGYTDAMRMAAAIAEAIANNRITLKEQQS